MAERQASLPYALHELFRDGHPQGLPRNHPIWFALREDRPLAFVAVIRTQWTSVRKLNQDEVTTELFGFMPTVPNVEVTAAHLKAMPVILTKPEFQAAPSQRAVDRCLRQTARELVAIYDYQYL
tara:strand:+ start:193 stop:564 length:372 start_codon:yes stop_codon:yes gene_type:complete